MIANDALVVVLKATIVLGAGLTLGRVLRRGSPAVRHHLWSATLAAALVLPALAFWAPRVPIRVPGWRHDALASTALSRDSISIGPMDRQTQPIVTRPSPASTEAYRALVTDARSAPARFHAPSLIALVVACWLIGAFVILARLALALTKARHLAAASPELDDAAWLAACRRLAGPLGARGRVRLVVSPAVTTPMAGGIVRPTIFLPESAAGWSDEVREVVLAHEMAHLAGSDPVRHLVSRATLAIYWFHPFAWLVARRAVTTCEQACDAAVLALGIKPSTYASVLLDFANSGTAPAFAAALPIVRPSQLEDRLMAILNFSRRRGGRGSAILTVAIAAVATPLIAAIEPAAANPPAPGVTPVHAAPPTAVRRVRHAIATSLVPLSAEAAPRAQLSADDACTWANDGVGFSGTMEINGSRGDRRMVGTTDNSSVIQTSFGDLRVCAVGEGMGPNSSDAAPSTWPAHARRVLLETRRADDVRRMEIAGGRTTWTVNGETKPVDAAATAWRDKLLALLDPTWQLSQLRGHVSSLRGEISSVEGHRSSLEGEISSLRGQVSSMEGEISSVRGQVSSMDGEISSVQGHLSSLEGEISSERGAISSVEASGGTQADVKRHEDNIRRIEDEIKRYDADGREKQIEARIAAFNADGQIAAINERLRTFNVDSQVDAVRKRIGALDVEGQTNRIEAEIDALHEDTRGADLQSRIDAAERQLRDLLGGQ